MGSTKHLVDLDVDGTVESTGFIKTSGTSSQFLKADGSVDSSIYLTTQTDTQDLSISGHTISLTNGGSVTVPDNNTQRTNSEIDARIALNPEGFIDSYTDTNTQLSDANIAAMGYIKTESDTQDLSISGQTLSLTNSPSITLPDTNTHRAISSTPVNGATTTSISSDWAFDNVKTAVPSGAVFTDNNDNTQLTQAQVGTYATSEGFIKTYTDTNTQRGIHDTPVNGATAISISSNWAFDNVKTAVPSGALFTDNNDNTQLTSAQITAMGYSTTDNDTTYTSGDFTHNSLSGVSANEHLDWTTDRGATNIHANNYANDNTHLTSAQITAMGFSTTDNDTTYSSSDFTHNSLSGVSANEHLDWTTDRGATNIHANNYANDNTQLNSAQITAMGFSTTDNDTTYTSSDFTHDSLSGVTANEHIDWTADQGATNIHSGNYTNTNTQLSDANIAAMGYIKTETDTQDLSISGHTISLTNGGSVTVPDNDTQLSSADITAMGFSTTDNDTQLTEAQITAMGFTQSAGTVGGNGAVNRFPKFSTGGTNVENSSVTDNGTTVNFGDGSITLNDASFNMIKASADMQIVGSSDAVHNLEMGSSTVDFNTITLRASSKLSYKADNVEKLTIDGNGHLDTVGNVTGANLSGTNTGNNAVNSLYSGLVSDVNHNVSTNLTTTHNASTVVVNSSDGTNATINAATATTAGIMSEAIYDQHVLNNAKVTFDGAYGSLSGTPTIPTNTSQLTNNSGFLTDASDFVTLSGGTQSIAGNKTFTGTTKFGTFGNLDTSGDKGMQFELGTSSLNTMRTDADAFRIYFGGTSSNGEALKILQTGEMTLKTQGTTEYKWDLDGDFHADGDVIAYSTTVSDRNLKENITTIENATETVKKLRGVKYDWKQGSGKREGQTEIGVIAQEIEEVLPFLVREKTIKDRQVKTVDYEKIIGLLIESNKELSDRLDKLEK